MENKFNELIKLDQIFVAMFLCALHVQNFNSSSSNLKILFVRQQKLKQTFILLYMYKIIDKIKKQEPPIDSFSVQVYLIITLCLGSIDTDRVISETML